jgi:hypothetical protein
MIQPAMFALIRDGETTLFHDPCGSALFARNLVWGQSGLEQWLGPREPAERFDPESEAGAVIDFDANAILWFTGDDVIEHPRSSQMLDALIAAAWPGFEILYADGISDLKIAAGESISRHDDQALSIRVNDSDPLEKRSRTLEEEVEGQSEFDPDDKDERYAWVTILDRNHTVHHRLIGEITLDLIRNEGDSLDRLKTLEPYDLPAEINVTEAVLFDEPSGVIRVWGGRDARAVATEMASHWAPWEVVLVESDGYDQQCHWSGPAGEPMSPMQALGSVLPVLLITKRIDPAMMLGEIGKSVKGCAAKVVAFLTVLFCFPFFVFALISGNWKTGGIAIGVVVGLVFIVFKWVEAKWRRGFSAQMDQSNVVVELPADGMPPVAGPIDSKARRAELDNLLRSAGMPGIAEVEPYFTSGFPGVS